MISLKVHIQSPHAGLTDYDLWVNPLGFLHDYENTFHLFRTPPL
jgi:hypothetical protein